SFVYESTIRLEAKVAQASAGFCKLLTIGEHHAAFACCYVLVRIEAEGADVAETAAGAASIGLAMSLRCILDDPEAVLVCQRKNRIHVYRQPVRMHHHDRSRPLGDAGLNRVNIDVPGARVAVDQYRCGSRSCNLVYAGDDCEGRHDDLVPDAQA